MAEEYERRSFIERLLQKRCERENSKEKITRLNIREELFECSSYSTHDSQKKKLYVKIVGKSFNLNKLCKFLSTLTSMPQSCKQKQFPSLF